MAKAKSNESDNVSKDMEEVKECFVMMPFGDPTGYQPDHFKRVFDYLIKPACEKAGFKAKRVDENAKTGIIMLEILDMIVGCDIAICDMSSRNPNVFYELGLRQAFDKKCVLIKDNKTDYPFDVNMLRTVEYDASLRIDIIQEKTEELASAIKETAENTKADGNSLVQLLSIKQPAKMLDQQEMDDGMLIVLNAIQSLSSKIDSIKKTTTSRVVQPPMILPNGEQVYIGDKLYKKGIGLINDEFGTIKAFSPNDVVVELPNLAITSLPLSEITLWEQLTKEMVYKTA